MSLLSAGRELACGLFVAASAFASATSPLLIPGAPVTVHPIGSRFRFRVRLEAGRLSRFVIQQTDLDASAVLRTPEGQILAEADEFEYGSDSLSYLAASDAIATLEIRVIGKRSTATSFTVALAAPIEPAENDLARAEAEKLSTRAKSASGAESPERVLELNQQAIAAWDKAAQVYGQAGSRIWAAGMLFARNDVAGARDLYLEALKFARDGEDQANVAEAATDAGYCELQAGRMERARALFEEALRASELIGSRYGRAAAWNNLGLWNWQTASFGAAIRAYDKAARLFRPDDAYNRGLVSNNVGLCYLSLASYRRAIAAFVSASRLLQHSDRFARGRAFINLGRAWLLRGSCRSAMTYCRRALALLDGSPGDQAHALNNLGQAYAADHSYDQAKEALLRSLALYSRADDRRGAASAAHHLGVVENALGEPAAALRWLTDSIAKREALQLRDDLAASWFARARVERQSGDRDAARASAERALDLIERLRTTIPGDDFRISYFSAHLAPYEFLIDLLMEMRQRDPTAGLDRAAFDIAERTRARTLLETVRDVKGTLRRGAAPLLLERESRAQEVLNAQSERLSRVLGRRHTAQEEEAASRDLQAAKDAYASVEQEIRETRPDLAGLFWPTAISEEALRRRVLAPDALLLEYSVGAERSYLWAVTSGSFESHILPGADRIQSLAVRTARLAADYQARMQDPAAQRALEGALADASKLLLGPVASKIGSHRLLIVPSGALQLLPFAALAVPGENGPAALPLGARNEVTILPSASFLAELRNAHRNRPVAPKSVAVLADPVFNSEDPRAPHVSGASGASAGLALGRLGFSADEATAVAAGAPPGSVLVARGFDASRRTLFSENVGWRRFLHLATHYEFNKGGKSGLVLSLLDRRGRPDAGWIGLDDLYAGLPRLSCEMVTVSACSTALGRDAKGEGLINLARAFFFAGSRRVLLTLWPCDDQATADFMGLVYAALFSDKRPAEALRAARAEFWRRGGRWKDPYFSAGFNLYGEYE